MRTSQFHLNTLRDNPSDAEILSHQLMLRAGMIHKLSSGLYTWMPLGLRSLRKAEQIIREEMNRVGAQELLMPMVQPAELWQESGRWDIYGPELLRFKDRHDHDCCLGPTHEEVITHLIRQDIHSYRQLPTTFYQIQSKFRDEIRPRFGIMRSCEFIMKDAYSFHNDQASLQQTYELMFDAYQRIFSRMGLKFRPVRAITGEIGGDYSHEFHVLAESGEDAIAYSNDSDYAANVEMFDTPPQEGDPSPDGQGTLSLCRGIEVGHIFQLGDKYTKAMDMHILDENGHKQTPLMGCYGIGVSRVVAAAIEQNHDDRGICWPPNLAPFTVGLAPINAHKSARLKTATDALYTELSQQHDVLYDDRPLRPGVMFADMDLIGIPHRLVLGEKGLDNNQIEYKQRQSKETQMIALDQLPAFLNDVCKS